MIYSSVHEHLSEKAVIITVVDHWKKRGGSPESVLERMTCFDEEKIYLANQLLLLGYTDHTVGDVKDLHKIRWYF